MSEQMSRNEIEDVLSSIRRLVSEDLRPAPAPQPASRMSEEREVDAPRPQASPVRSVPVFSAARRVRRDPPPAPAPVVAEAPAPVRPARLILTEALRVPEAAEAAAAPETARDTAPAEPAQGSRFPQAFAAHSSASDGFAFRSFVADRGAAPAPQPAAEPANGPAAEAEAGVASVVSRLGAAVGQGDAGWEPPEGEPMAAAFASGRAPVPEPQAEPTLHLRRPRVHLAPEPEPEPEPTPAPSEAAEAPGLPPGWADRAEAAALDELARVALDEAGSPARGEATVLSPDETPVFDESLLRDFVRDIIREELAGTLGERITRNIRKLVRAEIARSIALRDFD